MKMKDKCVICDTYTRRKGLYYLLIILLIIPIIFWVLSNILTIFQLSPVQNKYLGTFIIFDAAIFIFLRNSFYKMYIKDGEIALTANSIVLNSYLINISDIKKIIVLADDYKGKQKGTSDGSGNWIEIYDLDNQIYKKRFVINSTEQRNALQEILSDYSAVGLTVSTSGF